MAPPPDPLLQLVALQKASGSWPLAPDLAAALGKSSQEVDASRPAGVSGLGQQTVGGVKSVQADSLCYCDVAQAEQEVWATVLALVWLHGFKLDSRDEWELLAMKAAAWLRDRDGNDVGSSRRRRQSGQTKSHQGVFLCLSFTAQSVWECVDAGNALLGCSVNKDSLAL